MALLPRNNEKDGRLYIQNLGETKREGRPVPKGTVTNSAPSSMELADVIHGPAVNIGITLT